MPDALVATPALRLRSDEARSLQAEEAAGRVGGTSVVTDAQGCALYFSKRLIPHLPAGALDGRCRRCGCMSASMPTVPKRSSVMPRRRPASSRLLEGLEQLRFLVAGVPVAVVEVADAAVCAARAQQSGGCRADRAGVGARRASNERDWTSLDPKYRLILCDVWGVVHDGVTLYPGAAERLAPVARRGSLREPDHQRAANRRCGRADSSRASACRATAGTDRDQRRGRDRGAQALGRAGRLRRHAGRPRDPRRAWRAGSPTSGEFTDLACTGVTEERPDPQDYRADLERWAERDVLMHCLNPDRVVMRGGVPEACAGAIADLYEGLGGRVTWYGKPHADDLWPRAAPRRRSASRARCSRLAMGCRPTSSGAARMGFDAIFVSGGIHAGEPFPAGFREALRAWRLAPGRGGRRARLAGRGPSGSTAAGRTRIRTTVSGSRLRARR